MTPPQDLGARHPPPGRRKDDRGGNGWPVAAGCIPTLAGAVALVLAHRGGVTFLILFASCTALNALLMAGVGHTDWAPVQHRRVPKPAVITLGIACRSGPRSCPKMPFGCMAPQICPVGY